MTKACPHYDPRGNRGCSRGSSVGRSPPSAAPADGLDGGDHRESEVGDPVQVHLDLEGDAQLEPIMKYPGGGVAGWLGRVEFIDVDNREALVLLDPPEVPDSGFGIQLGLALAVPFSGVRGDDLDSK